MDPRAGPRRGRAAIESEPPPAATPPLSAPSSDAPIGRLYAHPAWEELSMFDAEDLYGGIFVLIVYAAEGRPLKGYIWVDSEADVEPLDAGRDCARALGLSETLSFKVERQDYESEDFFSFFVN